MTTGKQILEAPKVSKSRLSREAVAGLALSATGMGWRIVGANEADGRIEATATTRWFGFKDDVVIRIAPAAGSGSRVDIRSVSRVGLSDVGTNARRIREFTTKFRG